MQLLWMVATLFDHSDPDAFLWVNLLEEGFICLNSNPPGAPVANEITPLYWLFLIPSVSLMSLLTEHLPHPHVFSAFVGLCCLFPPQIFWPFSAHAMPFLCRWNSGNSLLFVELSSVSPRPIPVFTDIFLLWNPTLLISALHRKWLSSLSLTSNTYFYHTIENWIGFLKCVVYVSSLGPSM